MQPKIIKIIFWIIILTIIISVGFVFMQHSGQVLTIGLTMNEYQWLKNNAHNTIIIKSEENNPYMHVVFEKVEEVIGMETKIVETNPASNNEFVLQIKENHMESNAYTIPFAYTEDGKCLALVQEAEKKEVYQIVKKTIEHINQTQGLEEIKHEIDIQTNYQLCKEMAQKAFGNQTIIQIAYDTTLYPLTYSENGKAKGIAIDELNAILEILGLKAEYVSFNQNQSYDAIALVDQTYNLNKTDPYFLMDPVFVGQPCSYQTVWINEFFPSFKNIVQSPVYDLQVTSSKLQYDGGYVEDRRVYEAKNNAFASEQKVIINGRGNDTYAASLGCINLTKPQIEAINIAIEQLGTKEETLYKTVMEHQRLTFVISQCIVIFCVLCATTIVVWVYKQRQSMLQVQQINQMVKVDKETTRMLYAFADMLEGIDDEWYENNVSGHAARVSLFTECIVNEMYLSRYDKSEIIRAAIMHDMGKIEVANDVLLKQEILTHEEFQKFRHHCEAGYEIAERCKLSDVVKNVAMYHHEQWDGDGYYGLKGDKIPLEARIVALADVYDSIRVERVYHPSYTHKEATEVILQESGAMLDPELVEIFGKVHQKFEVIYRKNISL